MEVTGRANDPEGDPRRLTPHSQDGLLDLTCSKETLTIITLNVKAHSGIF